MFKVTNCHSRIEQNGTEENGMERKLDGTEEYGKNRRGHIQSKAKRDKKKERLDTLKRCQYTDNPVKLSTSA